MKNIPFYMSSIDENELEQIKEVLEINCNECTKVLELEESVSSFLGVKEAIATNSSTSATHLALSAIELKRGDKILMSVNSFVNLPEVVRHFDAEPIFVDINADDMNIDLNKLDKILEANTNKKLRGAIITHLAGQTTDLDKLYEIVKRHNIILIEDAAYALGATYNGETVGSLEADMTILSTNPSSAKYAVGRSGIIATNNEEFAERARLLRTHAFTTNYDNFGNLDYIYDVVDIGYKYDMSELDAAFSLAQLNKTNKFIKRRRDIAAIYKQRLSNLKHVKIPSHKSEHVFTDFIIKISKNRDLFAKTLKERGISTGLNYIPLHLLNYYKQKYGFKITDFGTALSSYQQILSIPIYPALSDDEVNYICDQIIDIESSWI